MCPGQNSHSKLTVEVMGPPLVFLSSQSRVYTSRSLGRMTRGLGHQNFGTAHCCGPLGHVMGRVQSLWDPHLVVCENVHSGFLGQN